jgi:ATP-dependent protease ClpP protease subunit
MGNREPDRKKQLSDYGIIFVSGEIDTGTAQRVCEDIIRINVAGESDFVQMIINSSGGGCAAGFAVIDLMEWSRLPVYTTGVGMNAVHKACLLKAASDPTGPLDARTVDEAVEYVRRKNRSSKPLFG